MTTIRRLTDSCVLARTDNAVTMFDPGFHTFLEGDIDLDSIGDITRVFITHEHLDHVHPGFVAWLLDRGDDVAVHSNQAVADLLAPHDIEVSVDVPDGVSFEDVLHERIPNGARPPNRSFTIDEVITHPGDSRQPTSCAPILALPLIVPWDSVTGAVEFARRLKPTYVFPIHDFYLSESGRTRIRGMAGGVLAEDGIEMLELDWGQEMTV
ncbi:MAG: MBL fold metallo-hydrolase [Acidimicrobiia bacterium]|jgi:L-ascorbate metabolism protein UlaG (beta-lactamase superfamily)